MEHVISWTSRKASPSNAQKALAQEIAKMADMGYVVQSTGVVEAGRSKRSWFLLGIFNFARSKQVQTTAIFRSSSKEIY